jgi:hypothetical protein
VTSGGGGSDKPPQPELHDDPMQYPASEAGWDDAHPPSAPRTTSGATTSGELAPATVEVSPAVADVVTVDPTAPTAASTPSSITASTPSPAAASATPTPPASPKPPTAADDEPVLPATYHENDLRVAVGAAPLSESLAATRKRRAPASANRPDGDDGAPGQPRNRKAIVAAALSITAGLAIVVLVVLGHANSDRYLLACEPERAVPEQGRGFPPWGTHALEGEPWKPLKITRETRCQPHETDDPLVLERAYLAMVLDQATALLTAREVTRLDDAEALLKQALLLTRPPDREPEKLALERNEHHKDIEHMLGDVTYWRASARLHDAQAALTEAAKQFDSAAAQHPRHVSDAAAWASYARKLAQELHAGPAGATPPASPPGTAAPSPAGSPTAPASEHLNVPAGVALPVEPGPGSAAEPPPALAIPDAGVPTGGVLL